MASVSNTSPKKLKATALAKGPHKNNFAAIDVVQSLPLPRPDSSGRVLEHIWYASRYAGVTLCVTCASVKLFLCGA